MATEDKKEYCVIDCRVSDISQVGGSSLEDQEIIGRRYAEGRNWDVAKVFKKPHSATTAEREDIEMIKQFISGWNRKNASRPIQYYIFKSIDRLTREGFPEYDRLKKDFAKIGVQICDSYGIIQPEKNTLEHLGVEYEWSRFYPSEAAEMLEAHRGKAEARDILTRMVGAEIGYVRDGYAGRRAPDGLKNKKIIIGRRERVVREADPERAHFFVKMFDLRAAGVDDKEIVKQLNAEGFKTRAYRRWDRSDVENYKIVGKRGGKSLTVKQLQRFVLQTEYAGINYEKWTKHQPVRMQQFTGIVSIDKFNRANRGAIFIKENADNTVQVVHNYTPWGKVKRMKDNPLYPWKVIPCPHCRAECLGSASRGKSGETFPAYHCGGAKVSKRAHVGFRVPKKEFEENIKNYLDSLRFDKSFIDKLHEKLIKKYREREKEIVEQSSRISHNVGDLKAEQVRKLDALTLTDNATVRRMLEEQVHELDARIKEAESKRGQIEITERSIKGFISYARRIMEHPAEIIANADNLQSRRALLSLFFEEVPTYSEIVNGTPKLQPLFKLSEDFKRDKTQLVTLPGIEPGF